MKWRLLLAITFVVGCATPRKVTREVQTLPTGEGVYEVRYNPPGCLADQPQLHLELKTTDRLWERIYVQVDEDDPKGLERLLASFGTAPRAVLSVSGTLTRKVIPWAGRHQSRVFVLTPPEP